ncbi:MAG: ATP-binding cassette domain-containing protein [Desulfovibrionaceae bacterium]|nr:ATP-binding cassette domain-containing protein [Desulfovibrionaceae bacterium]
MADLLVKITDLALFLPGDLKQELVLQDINLEIKALEHLALLGANGSGKSTLLRLIAGELWPAKGQIKWRTKLGEWDNSPLTGREMCRLVSPKLQANYQKQGWHLSGLELVLTGLEDSPLCYQENEAQEKELVYNLAKDLHCLELLDLDIATMSQGQLRILLLARALIIEPKILLLDECSDGLDLAHRQIFFELLEQVALKTTLVIATHRPKHLPFFCKQRLYLKEGRIVPSLDPKLLSSKLLEDHPKKSAPVKIGREIFKLKAATVFISGQEVLHNIDWTVREGEQWLIKGENGSGKSTLLRLLYGDEFCACGGSLEVWLPSLKGEPESLAVRREKISLVAPLAESTYGYTLTGLELVLSGFENTIGLYRDYSLEEEKKAKELIKRFFNESDLAYVLKATQDRLSTGQLRRLFLARALVADPDVLLLDEPCLGLDMAAREHYMQLLDQLALGEILAKPVTIILISHNLTDIPSCINCKALLTKGYFKVLEQVS